MLLSGTFKVTEIKKNTRAVFFKELQVGDVFTVEYPVNGRYKSAPKLLLTHKNGESHINDALQLTSNLENFGIIPVEDYHMDVN